MGVVGGLGDHLVPGRFLGQDEDAPDAQEMRALDLGGGVFIAPFGARYVPEGEHAGGIVWHTHANGLLCGGAVLFAEDPERLGRPVWTVESWDPLTISPSVLAGCGLHGYIREGRWESC